METFQIAVVQAQEVEDIMVMNVKDHHQDIQATMIAIGTGMFYVFNSHFLSIHIFLSIMPELQIVGVPGS